MATRRARRKSPTKSPTPKPGDLVVPAHGNGMIRNGSLPGTNAGGSGRPKSEVRAAALEGADRAIPKLIAIVENAELLKKRPAVVALAADKLLKYGLGTQKEVSVEDVKHRLVRTIGVLRDELASDVLARVVERLRPIWA